MAFYFIYKITQTPGSMVKQLEKIERFNQYKDAKKQVKSLRLNQPTDSLSLYKIIFADNELAAEELLQEKREEQIVGEWEK